MSRVRNLESVKAFLFMEIWKDILGYEGYYQVSNLGRVRGIDRVIVKSNGVKNKRKGFILNVFISQGYMSVSLSINGKTRTYRLHQLIAFAFLDHKPNGFNLVVDHIDGDKLNNDISNLRIITSRQNTSNGHKNKSSIYTNVCWSKAAKKWMAYVNKNYLGYFCSEIEAYKAVLKYEKENKNLQKLQR